MYKTQFFIVFLVVILHTCTPRIVIQTSKSNAFPRIYEAAIDVLKKCYDKRGGSAVGIVDDSDGSILKTLSSNYVIPAVTIDTRMEKDNSVTALNLQKQQVFVIATTSTRKFTSTINTFQRTIWWHHEGYFLLIDQRPDTKYQCDVPYLANILYRTFYLSGILNAEFICVDHVSNVWIYNLNPFTSRAPESWEYVQDFRIITPSDVSFVSLFKRLYRDIEPTCDTVGFAKTMDAGGSRFFIRSELPWLVNQLTNNLNKLPPKPGSGSEKWVNYLLVRDSQFMIDNIEAGLNVSAVLEPAHAHRIEMGLDAMWISASKADNLDHKIFTQVEYPLIGITQHPVHMTQLEKILSVTDKPCRYCMILVYVITFLFFKFFMHRSVIPSVLDLVRLTCNMGLATLPRNLAPTIYLSCLFMYVVTFQGIYTGNLASLLTTVIPYPTVNVKGDVAKLRYTIYAYPHVYRVLAEDAAIDGRIIELPYEKSCIHYVVQDPTAVCVLDCYKALVEADHRKLHLSREPMAQGFTTHSITLNNPFKSRIETIMRRWEEHSLRPTSDMLRTLHSQFVDDDEVKKNTFRRVMNLGDLSFAFVILGIGLTCASICFIGELVIYRIRMKMAKRRSRIRRVFVREAK